jgi:hypothetical protein
MSAKETVKEILDLGEKINKQIENYVEPSGGLEKTIGAQSEHIQTITNKVADLEKLLQSRSSSSSSSSANSGGGSRKINAIYKRAEKDVAVMTARREHAKNGVRGKVRVGRIAQHSPKDVKYPVTEGYLNIICTSHNVSGVGAGLSPFKLKDADGRNMENIWQFSKVYKFVPDYEDSKTGWKYPREVHIDNKSQEIKSEYWDWRRKGMAFEQALRYPVGYDHRQYCQYSIWPQSGKVSDAANMSSETPAIKYKYVPARVKIYCPVYMELAKDSEDLAIINQMLDEGYNVQILDVDGPRRPEPPKPKKGAKAPVAAQEVPFMVSAPYDQMPSGTYGESGVGSIDINEANIKALLQDVNQAFGHGYAIACMLLGHPEWITDFDVSALNSDDNDI